MTLDTERRLRDVLEVMARQITPDSRAYRRTQSLWRRRERRRRLIATIIAVTVIAGADIAGLWALNRSDSHEPVIFDGPRPHSTSLVILVPPGS